MDCKSCRFFDPFSDDEGWCRRYPPKLSDEILRTRVAYEVSKTRKSRPFNVWAESLDLHTDSSNCQWPTVFTSEHNWCGEYQQKNS